MAATISLSHESRPAVLTFEPRWAAGETPHAQRDRQPGFPGRQEPATVESASSRLDMAVYRRRRLVAGAALVVVGALVWTIATWTTNSSIGVDRVGADRSGVATEVYVVQPGDTLWSIAAKLDTDGDVRDTVDRLAERNGGSALAAGQRLVLGN